MNVTAQQDENADVLCVSLGEPRASDTVEHPDGLRFRHAYESESQGGVTVLDYLQAWRANSDDLAGKVAAFLQVPATKVSSPLHAASS